MSDLDDLLARQSGVVSRSQLLELGLEAHDVRRQLRRRELVVACPGVYLDHTGDPTWLQRAWTGVLALSPAALCDVSALRADDGPGRRVHGVHSDDVIHVAVDRHRSPAPPSGVRLHRVAGLDAKVRWNLSPPRLRAEEALLDVAAGKSDDFAAVAVLADGVQARRTTAARLQATLSGRSRIARRSFFAGVLNDVADGTCSVLEHGYLTRVERSHGLPVAARQVRDSRHGPTYRDVDYRELGLVVELDGRLFHDNAEDHDRDLERDLDVAIDGRATVRLGWGQVFRRSCSTAIKVGRLLQDRGWDGTPTPCPACALQSVRCAGATG